MPCCNHQHLHELCQCWGGFFPWEGDSPHKIVDRGLLTPCNTTNMETNYKYVRLKGKSYDILLLVYFNMLCILIQTKNILHADPLPGVGLLWNLCSALLASSKPQLSCHCPLTVTIQQQKYIFICMITGLWEFTLIIYCWANVQKCFITYFRGTIMKESWWLSGMICVLTGLEGYIFPNSSLLAIFSTAHRINV